MQIDRLFIANLSYKVTEIDLAVFWKQAGYAPLSVLICKREDGTSRGYGFIEIDREQSAEAIHHLNGIDFMGRRMGVERAKDRRSLKPTQKRYAERQPLA